MNPFERLNAQRDVVDLNKWIAGQQQGRTPRKEPDKNKEKDFWLDQISTLGGIVGGIAGVPLGLLGAGGGSAIGSGLGEALENAITGDDPLKDVGKEALLGGVFGAGPVRLAGAAASKVLPRAGQSVEEAGKNLLGTQANLTRAQARQIGAAPSETLGAINERTGLTGINRMTEVAENVTGKNGVLPELTRNAIGNTPGVDIADLRTVADSLLLDKAPLLSTGIRNNVLDQVKNSTVKAYGGSKGSLSTLADPYEAFDVARNFEANAARIRGAFNASPADKQLADVYQSLAQEIKGRLFSAPGVSEGLEQARGAAADSFGQLAKSAPSRAERKAYERLGTETAGFDDINQVRAAQAPFVQLGKVNRATAEAQAGAGSQLGDNLQGLGRVVQRPTNIIALPLNAATPWVGGKLAQAGRALQGGVSPVTRGGVARNVAGQGLLLGDNGGQAGVGSLEDALVQQRAGAGAPQGMGAGAESMTEAPEQSPYPRENLMADVARDPQNAEKYIAYYESMQEIFAPPKAPKFSSAQAGTMADIQKGMQTLTDLENMVGGQNYAGGVLQGNVRQFNPLDSDFKKQQSLVDASRQIVGKAMEGGVLRKEDEEKYKRILPTMQDDPQVALSKVRYIRSVLAQNLGSYSGFVGAGSPSDLEETLLAAQR